MVCIACVRTDVCVPFVGWVNLTEHTDLQAMEIAKVEEGSEIRPACIPYSVAVGSDLAWHVIVNGKVLLSSSQPFSALPQMITSVRCVLSILHYVGSLVLCVGNDDESFKPLATSRKGSFRDPSGIKLIFVNMS